MKFHVPALLSLGFVALAAATASAGGKTLDGQMAPEIALTGGQNGITAATTLASLRGRVVCLKFWLRDCPICRGTLPEFQSIHDQYGRSGVVCLGIVITTAEKVLPYLKEAGWTFGVGCDPDASSAQKYGVGHYPADYVIGIDGIVRASNGFPKDVIEDELRKFRTTEWGPVPAALSKARDAVADGDYGEAVRRAEAVSQAADAGEDVKKAVERLLDIARKRQDNRFARAEAFAAAGRAGEGRTLLERVVTDFRGTSLEARAKDRLAAFDAAHPR